VISGINRDLPIYDVQTMEDRFSYRTQTERFSATLYGSIGGLGLLLAAIGIYAVLAFSVGQRMPEMGIRSALGARPAEVRLLVLRNALTLTASGLAFGLVAALLLAKFLTGSLYQIDPHDPFTLAGAFLCVAITALASSLIPANRAAKVDPMRAMRSE
jgi:ABC-type antimicrobial peptide transport system permease subunit